MSCRGCSQVGDCACSVVGDGVSIEVTGTGGSLDPYVVTFVGSDFIDAIPNASPDLCTTDTRVLARLEDDSLAMIPAPKKCSDPGLMVPMCNTSTGVFEGWSISSVSCDGAIELEYFDEDGVSQGTTLPANWKPCVQGETGPEWTPTHDTLTYAATVDIDFAADEFQTLTVTGDVDFTGSNYSAATVIHIRLIESGATGKALTFPVGWKWLGFAGAFPTLLDANETALVTLTAFGNTESDVIARWEVAD